MKKNRAPKIAKAPKAEKAPKAPKVKVKACAQRGCRKPGISEGYCRLHYFANWKLIKDEEKVRAERRLNAYVDRLAKRYPDDYLEKIKEGIENEESFKKTMEQLEIESETEAETEREYIEKFARKIKGED